METTKAQTSKKKNPKVKVRDTSGVHYSDSNNGTSICPSCGHCPVCGRDAEPREPWFTSPNFGVVTFHG